MRKWPWEVVLPGLILILVLLYAFHRFRMPLESFFGQETLIQSALLHEEAGDVVCHGANGGWYGRGFENVAVEKRVDGHSYTSIRLSLTTMTLLVPTGEDVRAWQGAIERAKADHVAHQESLGKKRILPR